MNPPNNHHRQKNTSKKIPNPGTSPPPEPSTRTTNDHGGAAVPQACAACKYQRRRCAPNCPLAPYFPADKQKEFLNAHKIFGVSNIVKILRIVPPHDREDAMKSVIYQAHCRTVDPVGGCYRVIRELERRINLCRSELDLVLKQLAYYRVRAQGRPQVLINPDTSDSKVYYDHSIHGSKGKQIVRAGDVPSGLLSPYSSDQVNAEIVRHYERISDGKPKQNVRARTLLIPPQVSSSSSRETESSTGAIDCLNGQHKLVKDEIIEQLFCHPVLLAKGKQQWGYQENCDQDEMVEQFLNDKPSPTNGTEDVRPDVFRKEHEHERDESNDSSRVNEFHKTDELKKKPPT